MSRLRTSLLALEKLAKELGYWPSITEWNTYAGKNGYFHQQNIFYHTRKSWENMREEYGFPPKNKKYTKQDCIMALQQAAQVYGPTLRRKEYEEWRKSNPDTPSPMQIARLFHSYTNAKIEAGLIPNQVFGKVFTDEEIVSALKKCADAKGLKFTESQYEEWRNGRTDIPNIETVRKRLGSLVEAKKKIGLGTFESGPQAKYTDDRWQVPFMDFLRESLSVQNYERWAKENNAPSLRAIRDNAGSYSDALEKMLEIYLLFRKTNKKL